MSNIVRLIQPHERLRDQAIAALLPFFVDGPSGDAASARVAVAGILDGYHVATPKELQLATQIIAFNWAAMACLRAAMAAKQLSVNEALRLQGQAIALDRCAQKTAKALDVRRKERANDVRARSQEKTQWDEDAFQSAISQAMERLNNANAKLAAHMATLAPVEPKPRMSILSAEPMTPAVLARRPRH